MLVLYFLSLLFSFIFSFIAFKSLLFPSLAIQYPPKPIDTIITADKATVVTFLV